MKRASGWALLSVFVLASAPLTAQQLQSVKPMVAPNTGALQIDYRAQWEKERAKNAELRAENARLTTQLQEWTRKGGSLVHAYCATPTVSANSSGARNDCAASGYTCEPVSGLCRTSVNTSADCAAGWLMDQNRCVRAPGR